MDYFRMEVLHWLLLLGSCDAALGFVCNYNSEAALGPTLGDGGILESPNYPGEYSAYRSYCQVALTVCRGCVISLLVDDMTLPPCKHAPTASQDGPDVSCDPEGPCDYMLITPEGASTTLLSGDSTRRTIDVTASSVTLRFCFSRNQSPPNPDLQGVYFMKKWRIRFFVKSAYDYRITGTHAAHAPPTIIQSPGFPWQPRHSSHSTTYYIHGDAESDCSLLSFSDVNLCPSSKIKIYTGHAPSMAGMTYTQNDTPTQLLSTSPDLLVEWIPGPAASQTCPGFRAQHVFVPCQEKIAMNPEACVRVRPADGGVLDQYLPPLPQHWTSSQPPWTCTWSLPSPKQTFMLLHLTVTTSPSSDIISSSASVGPFLQILETPYSTGASLMSLTDVQNVSIAGFQSQTGLYIRASAVWGWSYTIHVTYTPYVTLTDAATDNLTCEMPGGVSGYTCVRSKLCIPAALVCDGHAHCWHGEDERLPACHPPSNTSACPDNHYYSCFDGGGCYGDQELCDGIAHCGDGSDEAGCIQQAQSARQESAEVENNNYWVFALPAMLLLLACGLAAGCSLYRRRYQCFARRSMDTHHRHCPDIQMHTFAARRSEQPSITQPPDEDDSLISLPLYPARSPNFSGPDVDYGETEPLMS